MKIRKDGIWVVVDVRSGIPVNVMVYRNEKAAFVCQDELQTKINPDNDEIGLFYVPSDRIEGTIERRCI